MIKEQQNTFMAHITEENAVIRYKNQKYLAVQIVGKPPTLHNYEL